MNLPLTNYDQQSSCIMVYIFDVFHFVRRKILYYRTNQFFQLERCRMIVTNCIIDLIDEPEYDLCWSDIKSLKFFSTLAFLGISMVVNQSVSLIPLLPFPMFVLVLLIVFI